jgi:hypothetical protein
VILILGEIALVIENVAEDHTARRSVFDREDLSVHNFTDVGTPAIDDDHGPIF